jgi:hypothetical protein
MWNRLTADCEVLLLGTSWSLRRIRTSISKRLRCRGIPGYADPPQSGSDRQRQRSVGGELAAFLDEFWVESIECAFVSTAFRLAQPDVDPGLDRFYGAPEASRVCGIACAGRGACESREAIRRIAV